MNASRPLLLDVRRLVWRIWVGGMPTGVDHVCLAYLEHYAQHAQAVVERGRVRCILSPENSDRLFAMLRFGMDRFKRNMSILGMRAMLSSFGEGQRGKGRVYLNVGHTGLEQSSGIALLDVKPVYLLHDLIPITHPEYCRAGENIRHAERVRTILKRGHGVIANSNDTVTAFSAFAQSEGQTLPPTLTAYLGTRLMVSATDNRAPLDRPYFVMLGTIEGRKNHILILNIWRDLVTKMGAEAPILVIIGKRGWECEQAVDLLERSPHIKGHVIELQHGQDHDVAHYFRHARALLFPSFTEGYGMPLIEALASGLPVIASDIAVFRELAGDIPEYFSPIDGIGWRNAIEAYLPQDSVSRAAQLLRMRDFSPPTWEQHFAKVNDWLPSIEKGNTRYPTGSSPSSRSQRRR
ncbi:glycosyltransferase family 4 protein [Sphingobium algorifonticola]|uniref:Glycosyltransferase family 1 protein n=1 Tax=Sphingobium algorifonticola TaxID=2008318 RepID=A0A437J4U4_9SPHN|nr:glycosyltransferase family 1 protein [Sphingobium algorifonticola]RVT39820.1 glycosyltransferase family 1 protein [Sphingobium algorifonticola]